MTSSEPESPIYLSPPSSPLTRQIAVPREEGFLNTREIYWRCHEMPPLYDRAVEFEPSSELGLSDAILALTQAWETAPDLQLCVRKPCGFAFQIFFGIPTAVTPSIVNFGIETETALEYVACDYIRHRYAGSCLSSLPRPAHWMRLYTRALEHACKLHLQILARILGE